MTHAPEPTPPALPVAPLSYAMPPQKPGSAWGTTLGIISIVISGLSILGSAMAVVQVVINAMMFPPRPVVAAAATGPAATAPALPSYHMSTAALATVGIAQVLNLCLAVVLLIGGIQLLRRKPNGRRLNLIWAWAKIPLTLIIAGGQYLFMRDLMNSMLASGATTPAMPKISWMALLSALMPMVLSLLYPITLLILLNLSGARRSIEGAVTGVREPATAPGTAGQ